MATSQSIATFIPKYAQPFSLQEAVLLDVITLTNEMARLEDSVSRLIATQDTLKEVVETEEGTGDVDRELTLAYNENAEVIGSQRERMQMIQMALEAKGVSAQSLNHYLRRDLPTAESLSQANGATTSEPADGGIDL